jgi:hypothetical protein
MTSPKAVDFRRKLAAISKEHEANQNGGKAALFVATAGWLAILCGILLMSFEGSSFAFGAVAFLSGLFAAWIGFVWLKRLPDTDRLASASWVSFFENWEIYTPAGERLVCIGCSFGGTVLQVRFEDGAQDSWPLSLLCDGSGVLLLPLAAYGKDSELLLRMSKCRWKIPDGRIGTVRGGRTRYEDESLLTLALPGGLVGDFPLSSLEPVRDAE